MLRRQTRRGPDCLFARSIEECQSAKLLRAGYIHFLYIAMALVKNSNIFERPSINGQGLGESAAMTKLTSLHFLGIRLSLPLS